MHNGREYRLEIGHFLDKCYIIQGETVILFGYLGIMVYQAVRQPRTCIASISTTLLRTRASPGHYCHQYKQ